MGNPLEERANPSCRDFLSERVCGRPHDQGQMDKDQGHAHLGIKTVAPAGKAEGKKKRERKKWKLGKNTLHSAKMVNSILRNLKFQFGAFLTPRNLRRFPSE